MPRRKPPEIKIGDKFSRWTVCGEPFKDIKRMLKVPCVCMCGKSKIVSGYDLASGASSSCGCIRIEKQTKHGAYNHKLYRVWTQMLHRCRNKNNKHYSRYGGRGIDVCESWLDFKAFMAWSLESGYREGLTIDRIDNDLGYYPGNCRWASRGIQARNRGMLKTNSSGVRHVYKYRGGWRVQFAVNWNTFRFGPFSSIEEAESVATREYNLALSLLAKPS